MAKEGAAPAADEYSDVAFTLSDEERAAIADDDDKDAGAGGEAEGKGGPPSSDKPEGKAAGAGSDDTPPAGDTKPGEEEEPEIPRGKVNTVQLRPTREVDPKLGERLTAIDSELEALDAKWENDEISQKEFSKQSRTLLEEKSDVKADLREHEFVKKANEQYVERDWNVSVANFLEENPAYSVKSRHAALNEHLRDLYADEKNIGASHEWFLQTAKRAVEKELGPSGKPADDNPENLEKPPSTREQVKQQAADAAKARAALPKTLGDAPAAAENDTGEDPFKKLDGLQGMDLEAALANMSEAQADKYLRAGK